MKEKNMRQRKEECEKWRKPGIRARFLPRGSEKSENARKIPEVKTYAPMLREEKQTSLRE